VGRARHAGDPQRFDDARGLLGADDALLVRAEDIVPFRRDGANWFWGSYTPVYLGVACRRLSRDRRDGEGPTPPGSTTARLSPGRAPAGGGDERRPRSGAAPDPSLGLALRHRTGPTPATLAALYRAKYFVGEAVTRVTRTAMTLGGAHALLKSSPLERFFATAPSRPCSSRRATTA
jgi:hypothetical protein